MKRRSVVGGEIADLSTREEQVLSLAAAGYLDKQIGAELGVSLNTLRTYWQRIRSKIGDGPRSALAVEYSKYIASSAKAPESGDPTHDWEIDFERDTFRRLTSSPTAINAAVGSEVPLQEALAVFHPQDQARVRSLLQSMRLGELNAYTYMARGISPTGVAFRSAYVQAARNEEGVVVMACGTYVPNFDFREPDIGKVEVGYWTLDLRTGEYKADESLCGIFQVDPGQATDREKMLSRFHPDEAESCRSIVSDAVAARKNRVRNTRRLFFDDGSTRWATLDLRIEWEDEQAVRALGTVMVFV